MRDIFAAFEAVITTHQRKSEFLRNLDGFHYIDGECDPLAKLREIQSFLTESVCDHFQFEEEELFPELLQEQGDSHTAQKVAEFQAEHRQLLPQAERFLASINTATSTSAGPLLQALLADFRGFFGALQRHAHGEDVFLVPLIESLRRRQSQRQSSAG